VTADPSSLTRRSLRGLRLPGVVSAYRPGVTERLYTNQYGGRYAKYPCPVPRGLHELYGGAIRALERPRVSAPADGPLDPSRVLFTAGSIMGIDLLLRCFCEPGEDAICVTSPTFPAYAHLATSLGAKVVDVPLRGEKLDQLDVDRVVAARAKITFLCSPSNPVSTSLDPAAILSVVERAAGLVVLDEAYVEFGARASLAEVSSRYPNMVVLRTLSKAWGLAGVRSGVVIAAPGVLDALRVVQDPFACTAPAQEEIARCLTEVPLARARIDQAMADRDALIEALRACPSVESVFPSETNFVLARLRDAQRFVAKLATRDDVMAMDASGFVPGCIKISLGTSEENAALLALVRES
jgi:histidinol-phosphate aminotransferase